MTGRPPLAPAFFQIAAGILLAIGAPLATPLAATAAAEPERPRPFLRGVVVSCPRYGEVWGSQHMTDSLRELKRLGVEWAAIHPYAGVRRDGSIRFHPADERGYLARAVEIARAEGVALFWKPHLAYWGSFAWRGDIDFGDDEAAWRHFFDGYREFIVDQARFAEHAGVGLFAVGVELERTTSREAEWRRILEAVREVYRGRVTYAANWDALERVPFWDAVDAIGVHAYFPLVEADDPDEATLASAWDGPLARLAELSARVGGKPVIFAEIGYNRSPDAARRPWEYRMEDTAAARALRSRLIAAAIGRAETAPLVEGMFWWKWIPGPDRWDRDFSMKDPEAREALARRWAPRPQVPAGGPR